ncbi:hypothetical protein KP509_23G054600 [Ceratopteris richardii]|uniref:Uncharacterized protein n=1 Tax=Ceratopteris richardii TaxID=49495 RepID=A0A8T2RZW9_CERRI|nr:hypothetical protein KP509_23G054600 [Ceratopteris richardii]KAH7302059.1 hypothetical protein KP509_23G054600 [Ceratopteris richardii]
MLSPSGWLSATGAGCAAAMSAVLAKLLSSQLPMLVQALGYGGVVLLNVLMWSLYVRSLKTLSSLQATVVNFASNFLISGFAGYLCFSENLSSQWFFGAFLIVTGIVLISEAGDTTEKCKTN